MVSAITVSSTLFAASTAFAVANGIFGARAADHVGSFQPINQRLVPATRPEPKAPPATSRPPRSAREVDPGEPRASVWTPTSPATSAQYAAPVPAVTPAPSAAPVTRSTASPASTANEKEGDDGPTKKETDDGAARDD